VTSGKTGNQCAKKGRAVRSASSTGWAASRAALSVPGLAAATSAAAVQSVAEVARCAVAAVAPRRPAAVAAVAVVAVKAAGEEAKVVAAVVAAAVATVNRSRGCAASGCASSNNHLSIEKYPALSTSMEFNELNHDEATKAALAYSPLDSLDAGTLMSGKGSIFTSIDTRRRIKMKKLTIALFASAALLIGAPLAVGSADAQTVVVKRGHAHQHGHVHAPRKKVVIIKDRRHHGWRHHQHVRGRGHMHHNHGTVGVSVR
jgi:hypothetical protein